MLKHLKEAFCVTLWDACKYIDTVQALCCPILTSRSNGFNIYTVDKKFQGNKIEKLLSISYKINGSLPYPKTFLLP